MTTVSCIMSNFNTDEKMLTEAIDSILGQTFTDFEFIIIDDCSTDNSFAVIERYAECDSRIKVIKNEKNKGLAFSLNKAIEDATGKYVARMDSDDIALPNRFYEQVNYLEHNLNIDILGTFAVLCGDSSGYSFTPFYSAEECRCQTLFTPCLIHPTVMMRRDFLQKYNLRYNVNYKCSQDFDMWVRCLDYGTIAMLPKVLLKYRIHKTQISSAKVELQKKYAMEICQRQLNAIGLDVNKNEMEYQLLLCGKEQIAFPDVTELLEWGRKLILYNSTIRRYDEATFSKVVYNRIFNLLIKSKMNKVKILLIIISKKELRTSYNLWSILYRCLFLLKYKFIRIA